MNKNTLRKQFEDETNEQLILYYPHSYSFNENYVLWLEEQVLKFCDNKSEINDV